MFVCSLCSVRNRFSQAQTFLVHFSVFHSDLIAKKNMVCPFVGCLRRKFDQLSSFRKHILRHQPFVKVGSSQSKSNPAESEDPPCNYDPGSDQGCASAFENNDEHEDTEMNAACPNSHDSLNFDDYLTKSVVSFIGSLYDKGNFTETQIQQIIESYMHLLGGGGYLTVLKERVNEFVVNVGGPDVANSKEWKEINRMFESCENMFDGFESHYLRMKEVEKSGAYIRPESFVLGQARDEKMVDSSVIIEPIVLFGQFIPFRKTLKGFLELADVYKEIVHYVNYLDSSWSESGPIENIIQGELWRTHIKPKISGKVLLPLNFSFDDYETNKELGTHTGVHKLGAGYIKIACLPPQFQSALENLFLVLLFHSGDKAVGNENIFRKVIAEFKFLEEEGIPVVTPEGVNQVYFSLCLVTGDNLGANGILGFIENFSGNYFCRICSEPSSVTKSQTESNLCKRRTPETYETDILIGNESLTGRKGKCVFNELKSFHVALNFHVDIMHDLDEGVWKYLMYSVIKDFLDKKRFSLDYFNELIQGFYYGCNEEKNKPPLITKDDIRSSKRLRLSGSEMKCLVRYFALLVGHLVQEEDAEVWNLYLKARKIQDIIHAPINSRNDVAEIKSLVKEHHSEYMRIFQTSLKPKFHFMVHEPELIFEIGPLDQRSCYRVEHKHKEGKDVAHLSHNRINLPMTITKRHQLKFAFRLLCGRGFVPKFEHSLTRSVCVQSITLFHKFSYALPTNCHRDWNIAKWLQVNGAKYTVGCVVLHSVTEDGCPIFGRVHVISICDNNVAYFVVQVLDVTTFDNNVHAYEVTNGQKWMYVNMTELVSYLPTEIRIGRNGKSYVAFRFGVACFKHRNK